MTERRTARFAAAVLAAATTANGGGCTRRSPLPPLAAPGSARPAVRAANARPQMPAPSVSRPPQRPKVHADRLTNGLTVYRVPAEPDGPCVALLASARDARATEIDALALEVARATLTRGTPGGVDVSIAFDDWYAATRVTAIPERFAGALGRLGRYVREPSVKFGVMKRTVARYLQAMISGTRGTVAMARTAARRGRYGDDHPWAADSHRRIEALSTVTADEIMGAWTALFAPGRSVLVIVAPRSVFPSVGSLETEWGELAGTRSEPSLPSVPPLRERTGVETHALWYETEQSLLQVLHTGPPPFHGLDGPAFSVLGSLMSGFGSASGVELRHNRGATYGVWSAFVRHPGVTELWWGAFIEHGELVDALDQHRDEVRRLCEEGVPREAFERVRAQLMAKEARRWASPAELADQLAERFLSGQRPDPAGLWSAYQALTVRDVQRVAQKYLDPDRTTVGVLGPVSVFRGLRRRGRVLTYRVRRPTR